jgi:hypothetical protein
MRLENDAMKFTKSQIASMVAAAIGFVVANWDQIEPEVGPILQRQWFIQHPGVREIIVAVVFLITLYARSLHPKLSGVPQGQGNSSDSPTNPASGAGSSPS